MSGPPQCFDTYRAVAGPNAIKFLVFNVFTQPDYSERTSFS